MSNYSDYQYDEDYIHDKEEALAEQEEGEGSDNPEDLE